MTFKVYCKRCSQIVDDYCFTHQTVDSSGVLIELPDEPGEQASITDEEAEESPARDPL